MDDIKIVILEVHSPSGQAVREVCLREKVRKRFVVPYNSESGGIELWVEWLYCIDYSKEFQFMDRVVKLTCCEFSAMEYGRVSLLWGGSLADPYTCSNFRSIGEEVNWKG